MAAVITGTLAVALPLAGQGRPQSPPHPPPGLIRKEVREVAVDFVVTNHRGRPIRSLRPGQVEIFDNGVRQRVRSLRLVTRSTRLAPANWNAVGLSAPHAEPPGFNLVALAFDGLAPGANTLARNAGLSLIRHLGPRDLAAVFVLRGRLFLLQPPTADRGLLDRAVRLATGNAVVYVNYQRQLELLEAEAAAAPHAGRVVTPTARAEATPSWLGASAVIADGDVVGAMLRAARIGAQATGQSRARAQSAALRALVGALAQFHGRKAAVFFTQRLYVTQGLRFLERALIRAANRRSVSFYPVSVSGLGIRPDLAALAQGVRDGRDYANVGYEGQTVLLGELAAATGGWAVTDTNAPADFMSLITRAVNTHYELAFKPRGFAPGRVPVLHHVVIRIPSHRRWRVYGRKNYYVRLVNKKVKGANR